MKSFGVGYLMGIAFTVAFYFLFPILMGWEFEISRTYLSDMLQKCLIIGIIFGCGFYIVSLISEHNRRKRELEDAMTEFFRNNSKN